MNLMSKIEFLYIAIHEDESINQRLRFYKAAITSIKNNPVLELELEIGNLFQEV